MGEGVDSSWPQPAAAELSDRHSRFAHEATARPVTDWLDAQPAVRWRELLAVSLAIAVSDLTIYRGEGYAGLALLFVAAPLILLVGSPRVRPTASFFVLAGMLTVLALRLVWLGSPLGVVCGFALVLACSVTLDGRLPHVAEVLLDFVQSLLSGFVGLFVYGAAARKSQPQISSRFMLGVVLPSLALVSFGTLFILANPDLANTVRSGIDWFFRALDRQFMRFAENLGELLFWILTACLTIGLLRPIGRKVLHSYQAAMAEHESNPAAAKYTATPHHADLYWPWFNTLLSVIVLFAVYLVFEVATLWFREFPPGFYYSGYAHEGAAWLTVALGLSTVVLSLVFRGQVLDDYRIPRLRRLAWIWSAENLLLTLTVYHRMSIYIDFNGMTRMRVVGLYGISTVVVGFLLVLCKIAHSQSFTWLVRGQLGALALAIYLFALTPVDAFVHRYNVGQILSGHLAPAVQITEHPVNAEGMLLLTPLVESKDPIIREGIRAMLAERALESDNSRHLADVIHWSAWQGCDVALRQDLERIKSKWEPYRDCDLRQQAIDQFKVYAYQWY